MQPTNVKTAVEIFALLGERLALFGKDAHSSAVIASAADGNGWFTEADIRMAAEALRCDMLQADKLCGWLSSYDTHNVTPRRVAVIMAGNIPMVGFFDLMCVVACGHTAVVKPSGKDRVLMHYIIEQLRDIEPQIKIEVCDDGIADMANIDAVIATGNDNAKRAFKALFADKPQLLRGSRHSAAVLSGRESREQIEGLQTDIFSYSGLGCRNVSMIFIPEGYELKISGGAMNPKLRNNFIQTRALLSMRGCNYVDAGGCLLVEGDDFSSALSVVTVKRYRTLSEVAEWLSARDEELQCVVSECMEHPRRVGFGEAQHPKLTDYPDAVDVMAFLCGI